MNPAAGFTTHVSAKNGRILLVGTADDLATLEVSSGGWPIELVGVVLDNIDAELAGRLDAALDYSVRLEPREHHACA